MILKELDPFFGNEPFELAGRRAEEQMAFYLRREFGHTDDVFVINGLRLEREGDTCQIDHLLVNPYGFTIIESKSVTTEVRIDEKGNWSRLVDGQWRGMPSPINQAKLQFLLLRQVLNDYAPHALGKLFGRLQMRFGGLTFDAFAAVSDNGIINWPSHDKYDIFKADGVCEQIKDRLSNYKSRAGVVGFAKGLLKPFRPDEVLIKYSDNVMVNVAKHLVSLHKPRERPTVAPENKARPTSGIIALPDNVAPNPTPESTAVCSDCPTKLSPRVMEYCRAYPHRFGGRLYCMTCQRKY